MAAHETLPAILRQIFPHAYHNFRAPCFHFQHGESDVDRDGQIDIPTMILKNGFRILGDLNNLNQSIGELQIKVYVVQK